MNLNVKITGIKDVYNFLNEAQQNKVAMRTLNRLARDARPASRRAIREEYNIKASDVKVETVLATASNLTAWLKGSGRRVSLIKFGARQNRRGVAVQVKRGSTKTISGAFIKQPQGRNWKKYGQRKVISAPVQLVLQRQGRKAYPLKGLDTLSVGQMLRGERSMKAINTICRDKGASILQHELEFLLSRMRNRR